MGIVDNKAGAAAVDPEDYNALVDAVIALQAGGGITSPLDLAGCALWLDASTLVLADDAPVETWPDGSASGYDATSNLTNEIATVYIGVADGGTYTLDADDGPGPPVSVGPIAFDADAAAIEAAFTAAGITTSCTFGGDVGALTDIDVEFTGSFGGIPVTVSVTDDSTTGGDPGANVFFTELTPGGVSSAPVCKTNVLNGKRVVRFGGPGDDQYLKLTGGGLDLFRALDGFTLAAVWAGIPGSDDYVFQASSGTDLTVRRVKLEPNTNDLTIQFGATSNENEDADREVVELEGTGVGTHPVAFIAAVDFLGGGTSGSAAGNQLLQNAPTFTDTPGPTPDTASLAIHIGATPDIAVSFLEGDVAELIVYQRALNALERRELLEYLSVKWATL